MQAEPAPLPAGSACTNAVSVYKNLYSHPQQAEPAPLPAWYI